MPINDTTTNRAYQKPNVANALSDDVARLRTALDSVDTDVAGLLTTTSGLSSFTLAESTAAPNATVPVDSLTATNAGFANIDIALVPKGQGAILAQIPDSTATSGNKRGIYATDLQRLRTAGTPAQVASGDYSVIPGGLQNTASGFASTVLGGAANTANGIYSTAGGVRATTRSINGFFALSACADPVTNSTQGTNQLGLLIIAVQTTDATPTVLRSNTTAAGTANQLTLANNAASYVRGSVIANVTGGGNTKAWTFECAIKRGANAAATSIVGTASINVIAQDAGASAWTIALSADTTNGALQVQVTGQAATTIRWVCKLETTEVTF